MCERERIIAVDFDGCLCENAWPDIGEAKQDVIDALLLRQESGAKIILWTCRVGEQLSAAVRWCTRHGIVFDAINENLPVNVVAFGNDCRKIFADEYWDDKAVNPEICDPSIPSGNTDNPPMLLICRNEETVKLISEERSAFTKAAQPVMPHGFIETPIDPEALGLMRPLWNPKEFPGDSPIVPTDAMSMRSEVFILLRELARMFYNGTEWNKKARIVLEYDPDKPKVQIRTFMERDEVIPVGDRQSFLD